MVQPLEYARPTARQPSRVLALFANLTLLYPLFLIGSVCGEWYLAWYMLGHEPRPSLDDPKFISGSSWMHPITAVAIMSFMPAACAAVVLHVVYAINKRPGTRRLVIRSACLLALWLGMIALLRMETRPILEWWID